MLIVVTLLGIIGSVLAGSIILLTRTTRTAPDKLEESSGAQGLATYLQADVQSAQAAPFDFVSRPNAQLDVDDSGCSGVAPAQSSNVLRLLWTEPSPPGTGLTYHVMYRYEQTADGDEWLLVRYSCDSGNRNARSVPVAGNLAPPQAGWAPGQKSNSAVVAAVPAVGDPSTDAADGYALTLTTVGGYVYTVEAQRVNNPRPLCALNPSVENNLRLTTTPEVDGSGGAEQPTFLTGEAPTTIDPDGWTLIAELVGSRCDPLQVAFDTGVDSRLLEMVLDDNGVATATLPSGLDWLPGSRRVFIRANGLPVAAATLNVTGCELDVTTLATTTDTPGEVGVVGGLIAEDVLVTATPVDGQLCKTPLVVSYQPLASADPVSFLMTFDETFNAYTHVIELGTAFDSEPKLLSVTQQDSADLRRFSTTLTVGSIDPPACTFDFQLPPTPEAVQLIPGNTLLPGNRVEVLTELSCGTPTIRYRPEADLTTPVDMTRVGGSLIRYEFEFSDTEMWSANSPAEVKNVEVTSSLPPVPVSETYDLLVVPVPSGVCVAYVTAPDSVQLDPDFTMPPDQRVKVAASECGTPQVVYQRTDTEDSGPTAMTLVGGVVYEFIFPPTLEAWDEGVRTVTVTPGPDAPSPPPPDPPLPPIIQADTIQILPPQCQVTSVVFTQKDTGGFVTRSSFFKVKSAGGIKVDGDFVATVTVNDAALCGNGSFEMNWSNAPDGWTGDPDAAPSGNTYTFTVGNNTDWSPAGLKSYSFNGASSTGSIEARL